MWQLYGLRGAIPDKNHRWYYIPLFGRRAVPHPVCVGPLQLFSEIPRDRSRPIKPNQRLGCGTSSLLLFSHHMPTQISLSRFCCGGVHSQSTNPPVFCFKRSASQTLHSRISPLRVSMRSGATSWDGGHHHGPGLLAFSSLD